MMKKQITQKAFIESLNEVDQTSEMGHTEKYQANCNTSADGTLFMSIKEAKEFWQDNEITSTI